MKVSTGVLLRGAVWTIGGFGAGQAIRFVANVILTRLLAPQLFGLMAIVNTIRVGIELISDLGIAQNIIYSPNAYDPEFYNTAWSLQIIRGLLLWLVIVAAAVPAAHVYDLPILVFLLPITGIGTVLYGFASIGPMILQKRLLLGRLSGYQVILGVVQSSILISFVYVSRTIWAMVLAGITGAAAGMVGSHLLLPDIKPKFHISRRYVREIVGFGKWISLSSLVYFLATNFDRLYFAKVVPLTVLGIYSIARSISDLLNLTAVRLGNSVVFPFVSSHASAPRDTLHAAVASIRARYLLLAAFGCSLLIAGSDLVIRLIYDQRYHAAGWMLPVLIVGSWFSIVASLNESTLLGLGAPSYMAVSNSLKFILLLVGLPLSFRLYGFVGAVIALAMIEACRYFPIWIGQRRERFSFGRQDLGMTIAMALMVALCEWLRWSFGFGTSFDSLPLRDSLSG